MKFGKNIDEMCYPFMYESGSLCDFEIITKSTIKTTDKITLDGKEYLIMRESDILGVLS